MTNTIQTPAKISCITLQGYKIELDENLRGQPVARLQKLLTAGRNKGQYKTLEGYYFKDNTRREEWIKEKITRINDQQNEKDKKSEAKKAVRANMQHGFEVGQIYYDSWGYDQTNIDFYEVVEVKAKSVVIREIGSQFVEGTQGMDCSNVKPVAGNYIGEPMLKQVVFYINAEGKPVFHIKSRHGWISRYDMGEKGVYSSWYH